MNVTTMKRRDFDNLPVHKWDEPLEPFDSLVIIPTYKKHDSGFQIMDFVPCNSKHEPICRIHRGSDVIHIDGLGGYGEWAGNVPKTRPIEAWSIDCLPCGYLRLFCRGRISTGYGLSDFEIFWNPI